MHIVKVKDGFVIYDNYGMIAEKISAHTLFQSNFDLETINDDFEEIPDLTMRLLENM